eukprot:CAMPEP_0204114978 /NCGR_PEP_ID=MMETSP0361-20130328/4570_1 /ASSEMBLY_ACC=CAM_ASM_000343 /TAXON_ID=268821 /ORGANISM="Scrippsiella Hangoei, Strain SHTV-5" /LENGTH=215 /DNA_ID=CAMNT_0051065587 /DNA_START=55 /DNA_END=702 /DNA_ORIENTATION=+
MKAALPSRQGKSSALQLAIVALLALITARGALQMVFVQGFHTHPPAGRHASLRARGCHKDGEPKHSHGHQQADEESYMVGDDVTPLMNAAHEGVFEKVLALIQKGPCDINSKDSFGWTALRYAARNNHSEVVSLLIDNGADVNLASKTGRTPLSSAAANGHEKICEMLVEAGADIMMHDETFKTAYDLAMRGGRTGSQRIRDLVAGGQTLGVARR